MGFGAELSRQDVGLKSRVGPAAGLAAWTLSRVLVAPRWAKGKAVEKCTDSEGQAWVFFSMLFTFCLSLSLSTNHVSLSLLSLLVLLHDLCWFS